LHGVRRETEVGTSLPDRKPVLGKKGEKKEERNRL
jgi:hypothetical protein